MAAKPVKKVPREVQAGGGRGDTAGLSGVNGLIPLAVERSVRAIDVGGKRQPAQSLKKVQHTRIALEAHGAGAVWVNCEHATLHVFIHGDDGALLESSAGPNHRSEVLGIAGLREEIKNLSTPATGGVPEKSGGEDPAPVHDQEVAFLQQVQECCELAMPNLSGRAIEGEEP